MQVFVTETTLSGLALGHRGQVIAQLARALVDMHARSVVNGIP